MIKHEDIKVEEVHLFTKDELKNPEILKYREHCKVIKCEVRLTLYHYIDNREINLSKYDIVKEVKDRLRLQMWRRIYGELMKPLMILRQHVSYMLHPQFSFRELNDEFKEISDLIEEPNK